MDVETYTFETHKKLFDTYWLRKVAVPDNLLNDTIDAVNAFIGRRPTVTATPLDDGTVEYTLH